MGCEQEDLNADEQKAAAEAEKRGKIAESVAAHYLQPMIAGEKTPEEIKALLTQPTESLIRLIDRMDRYRQRIPGKPRTWSELKVTSVFPYRNPPEFDRAGNPTRLKGKEHGLEQTRRDWEHALGTTLTLPRVISTVEDALQCIIWGETDWERMDARRKSSYAFGVRSTRVTKRRRYPS